MQPRFTAASAPSHREGEEMLAGNSFPDHPSGRREAAVLIAYDKQAGAPASPRTVDFPVLLCSVLRPPKLGFPPAEGQDLETCTWVLQDH